MLSASLKPVLRKALDTLGKRAGAEKRAALQATYDRSISAVSRMTQPQPYTILSRISLRYSQLGQEGGRGGVRPDPLLAWLGGVVQAEQTIKALGSKGEPLAVLKVGRGGHSHWERRGGNQ